MEQLWLNKWNELYALELVSILDVIEYLQSRLLEEPDNKDISQILAHRQEEYDSILAEIPNLQSKVKADPSDLGSTKELARLLYHTRQHEEAIRWLVALIAVDRSWPSNWARKRLLSWYPNQVSPVTIKRAQLRRGQEGVDTTVKLSKGIARQLAPQWDMVMGVKNGTLSEDDYTSEYLKILNSIPESTYLWLHDQAQNGIVTVLCFCRSEWFCHTHLLINYVIEKYPALFKKEDDCGPNKS